MKEGCAFIGFDTNCIKDGATEAEEEQLEWLEEQFRQMKKARFCFVFIHCPIVREDIDEAEDYFNFSKEQRRRYLDLFKEYGVDAVFAGHTHCQYSTSIDGIGFYTASAVGNCLKHGIPGFHVVKVGGKGFEVIFVPTPGVNPESAKHQ